MGWSNQSVSLIVLDEATSGYSGIFGYSPLPGEGTLIFSLAAKAGTDPYGNPYPAGLMTTAGGSTIEGDDYVINSAGAFFYSGTPAHGNLIASIASVSGTDQFGNTVFSGVCVYDSSGNVVEMAAGEVFLFNDSTGIGATLSSEALLIYQNGGGLGNLIVSMASAAGSDQYGNSFPRGFGASQGAIPGGLINAGTITAALLAAGIVVAGIVDGTTITGATIVADGTSGEILVYSGTPAKGNLIASVSGSSGTDSHGNSFVEGVGVYDESTGAIAQLDEGAVTVTNTAASAGNGSLSQVGSSRSGITGGNIAELVSTDSSTLETIVDIFAPNGTSRGLVVIYGWEPTGAVELPVNLVLHPAGSGLAVKEGTNARMGKVTLSGGTATVANTSVTTATRVWCFHQSTGANVGTLSVSITPGTGFTIHSANSSDANSVAWLLIEASS